MKNYSQIIRHKGNSSLFDILDVSVAGSLSGMPIHVHAEGLRGTGKTTIIRAYKEVLPMIDRIKGCLFNCHPSEPHCPEHCNLSREEINSIGIERIKMPFLEISPSAKKGTVVGSIDLKKLTSKERPEAALLLGTIPKAHRGIVFIDEINRIADTSPEIVDLLLDVMGTKPGRIQIEEAGLPVTEIPVQVTVWAASNPDEDPGPLGEIRRQLSDRFDFSVNVERPKDIWVIYKILDGSTLNSDNNITEETKGKFIRAEENLRTIGKYEPSKEVKQLLSSLYVDHCIESLRSVEAALLGTRIRGALLKRCPNIDDVIFITKYALRHRMATKDIDSIMNNLEQRKNTLQKPMISNINTKTKDNKSKLSSVKGMKKELKENPKEQPFTSLKNLIKRLTNNLMCLQSNKNNNSTSNSYHQTTQLKAPPEKALPIKELDAEEHVKTEAELLR